MATFRHDNISFDRAPSGAPKAMTARKKSAKLLRCPTCGALVQPKGEDFPFCGDRCRKIDLGKWATGAYKISSPVLDPEVLEDLGGRSGGRSEGSHDN